MLDVTRPSGQLFEAGKQQGIQEEQSRVYRILHDKLSPVLVAAAFVVEDLVEELGAIHPGSQEKAVKIRTLLGSVFDEMQLLFGPIPPPVASGP